MDGTLDRLIDLNVTGVLESVVRVAVAFLVAIPVAWDRERAARSGGMRTFPLLAAVSAAYVLIAREALADYEGGDPTRVLHGLMTGLGFLGAGAIMQARGERVRGMATAVAIWSTAAIGASIAYDRLDIALILVAVDLIGLRLMRPVKAAVSSEEREARQGEPRQGEARRDEARRDEARRDEAKRDEARRDEARRDEARRDEPAPSSG